MAKKIVLFADGTGNAFSTQESNVWRLSEALDASNDTAALYLPGVGTSSFKPWALLDGATGFGVPGNVCTLYTFLCDNWESGAKIYMFGFSRGAFTIRTLIGLIANQGIVAKEQPNPDGTARTIDRNEMQKYAVAAYVDYRLEIAKSWKWYERPPLVSIVHNLKELLRKFRKTAYEKAEKVKEQPSIEFVGLFDTVEAYGVPIDEMRQAVDRLIWPVSFRNGRMSTIAKNVRHALSLDDERTSFHPLRIEPASGEPIEEARKRIKEVWFAGAHSDVGGGYPDGALSYVPIVWMLNELNTEERIKQGDGLTFFPDAEKHWRAAQSFSAPRHDPRNMTGALYRYAPRSTQARSRFGETQFDPPVVHHTVIERIAFGNDRYTPSPLTKDARVLLPDGTVSDIFSKKGELPNELKGIDESATLPRPLAALKSLDGPKEEILEKAQDRIWWRRLMYFVMLALLGAFIALPAYADGLSDWLCERIKGVPGVEYWLRMWEGFGNAIGPIVGFLLQFVAGYVGPYLKALHEHPAITLVLVLTIVSLYLSSDALAKAISDLTYKAWTKHGVVDTDGAISWFGRCVRRLRANEFSKGVYSVGANVIVPGVWGLVLILFLGTLLGRVIFDFRSGANLASFCTLSTQLRTVSEAPVTAARDFETNKPCWPSGLEVAKGQKYLLTLTIKEPWVDRTIVADAAGFETSLIEDPAFSVTRPLLRWAFDPWFRPIARIIGDRGAQEWPLQFKDVHRNEIKAPTLVNAKCPATPKRYESSPEFCEAHSYQTKDECAAFPISMGYFEPLDGYDRIGAHRAFDNAVNRSSESGDCRNLPKTRKVFSAEFDAHKTGELFLFVNDAMPIFGFLGDFYANNLGSASVTLQRVPFGESSPVATVANAESNANAESKK
ncbi:DUF2235 domain-containing protein [Methylocystis rosea]|uniref:DUF2235 domain-containing protein n=1 Tax=Methylocystis rosea TaxID=173366 RepID=A0ABX6EFZ2_9HYPH|nr:DUF2235 domain-containing protein [Methylocystis rosea]QGM93698.1 DUF2235 domain-containing protein [Methylocystis rosea]